MNIGLSLIICIVGAILFAICDGREKIPAFVAKLAFAAYWTGLLAFLFGH